MNHLFSQLRRHVSLFSSLWCGRKLLCVPFQPLLLTQSSLFFPLRRYKKNLYRTLFTATKKTLRCHACITPSNASAAPPSVSLRGVSACFCIICKKCCLDFGCSVSFTKGLFYRNTSAFGNEFFDDFPEVDLRMDSHQTYEETGKY